MNIFSRRNLQPSGPSGLTANVIGHTVQTLAIEAQIADTLVNVDLAEITLITDQAIARVIGLRIQTLSGVLAFLIVT